MEEMTTLDLNTPAEEAVVEIIDDTPVVEIVDDTPPQDQNRNNLPPKQVEELETDDLADYSEKARNRLGQLKKVWHDERRAKEAATREREEAIHYARAKDNEIKELYKKINHGEKVFVTEISKSAGIEVSAAKEQLKKAYEAGDADLIADAQEALTDAKFKLRDIQSIRPSLQEESLSVEPQQQAPTYAPDVKAETWRSRNQWFGVDEEMTSLALGLHEKLVRSGIDPRSDDYYVKVDATMKKRFPEQFDGVEETEEPEKPVVRARPANVVAPATRTTAPKRIRLTASALAIAKRMGVSPEAYAREMMKLENNNG